MGRPPRSVAFILFFFVFHHVNAFIGQGWRRSAVGKKYSRDDDLLLLGFLATSRKVIESKRVTAVGLLPESGGDAETTNPFPMGVLSIGFDTEALDTLDDVLEQFSATLPIDETADKVVNSGPGSDSKMMRPIALMSQIPVVVIGRDDLYKPLKWFLNNERMHELDHVIPELLLVSPNEAEASSKLKRSRGNTSIGGGVFSALANVGKRTDYDDLAIDEPLLILSGFSRPHTLALIRQIRAASSSLLMHPPPAAAENSSNSNNCRQKIMFAVAVPKALEKELGFLYEEVRGDFLEESVSKQQPREAQ